MTSMAKRVLTAEVTLLKVASIAVRSASSMTSSARSAKMASATARMVATTPSSRRVRGRRRTIAMRSALEHDLAHLPDRQEHPEREQQHQHAERHGNDRLDVGGEGLDLVVDLALVHVGDLAEQRVELAGLL